MFECGGGGPVAYSFHPAKSCGVLPRAGSACSQGNFSAGVNRPASRGCEIFLCAPKLPTVLLLFRYLHRPGFGGCGGIIVVVIVSLFLGGLAVFDVESVEREIESIYRWWAVSAPGVTPVEAGRLGDLWREFDRLVASDDE